MQTKNHKNENTKIVDKLCEITAIQFTEEEKEEFINYFQSILKFICEIKNIDTSSVEEISKQSILTRPDITKKDISKEDFLKNTPNKNNGFIVLPKLR